MLPKYGDNMIDQFYIITTHIGIALPGILIAATVSYYFSQRRYSFEKIHDLRLGYVEEIYKTVVLLEDDLKKYVCTTGSMANQEMLEKRKQELKPIQDKVFELRSYFRQKEIFFDSVTATELQSFIDTSIQVLSKLQASNLSLSLGGQNTSSNQWNDAYETMEFKLTRAKISLKKEFRTSIGI